MRTCDSIATTAQSGEDSCGSLSPRAAKLNVLGQTRGFATKTTSFTSGAATAAAGGKESGVASPLRRQPPQPGPPARGGRHAFPDRQWRDSRLAQELKEKLPRDAVEFKVASYNVLADDLMRMHMELYPGAKDGVLAWEQRYPRLLEQITAMDADILCLQEVQGDHFKPYYKQDLGKLGYAGIFKQRTGGKVDGCAIFYKSAKVTC